MSRSLFEDDSLYEDEMDNRSLSTLASPYSNITDPERPMTPDIPRTSRDPPQERASINDLLNNYQYAEDSNIDNFTNINLNLSSPGQANIDLDIQAEANNPRVQNILENIVDDPNNQVNIQQLINEAPLALHGTQQTAAFAAALVDNVAAENNIENEIDIFLNRHEINLRGEAEARRNLYNEALEEYIATQAALKQNYNRNAQINVDTTSLRNYKLDPLKSCINGQEECPRQCKAINKSAWRCKKYARNGQEFCNIHSTFPSKYTLDNESVLTRNANFVDNSFNPDYLELKTNIISFRDIQYMHGIYQKYSRASNIDVHMYDTSTRTSVGADKKDSSFFIILVTENLGTGEERLCILTNLHYYNNSYNDRRYVNIFLYPITPDFPSIQNLLFDMFPDNSFYNYFPVVNTNIRPNQYQYQLRVIERPFDFDRKMATNHMIMQYVVVALMSKQIPHQFLFSPLKDFKWGFIQTIITSSLRFMTSILTNKLRKEFVNPSDNRVIITYNL